MNRDTALKWIRAAWICGLISAVLTAAIAIADLNGAELLGLNEYAFIDVAMLAGLSIGVAWKSRACAVLLLVFFVVNKIIMWGSGVRGGYVVAAVFAYYYWQGVRGTFAWHSAGAEAQAPGAAPASAAGARRFRTREEYEQWKASRS